MNVSGTSHPPSISGNRKTQQSDQKNGNSSGMPQAIKIVASTSGTPGKNAPSALVPQTSLNKKETKILSEGDTKILAEINKWLSNIQVFQANRVGKSKPLNESEKRMHALIEADRDKNIANFEILVKEYGVETIAKLLTNPKILIPSQTPSQTPGIHPTLNKLQGIPISGFGHNNRRRMNEAIKKSEGVLQLKELLARRRAFESQSASPSAQRK